MGNSHSVTPHLTAGRLATGNVTRGKRRYRFGSMPASRRPRWLDGLGIDYWPKICARCLDGQEATVHERTDDALGRPPS